jgi:hypothetical protein
MCVAHKRLRKGYDNARSAIEPETRTRNQTRAAAGA